MKLLHIDSSIQGEASASRVLSAQIVEQLKAAHPGLEIVYRDLVAKPIDHLTFEAFTLPQPTEILTEFLSSDIIVIGAALYNFTIPSQLKAWFDRIIIAGHTFRFGASGAEGLAGSKRAIVALARGGVYSPGSPAASFEHAESLLRTLLGFIGLGKAEFIVAEGLSLGPDARKERLEGAILKVREIAPMAAAS
jgi:FMN-dependent NADH-azoreductase